MSYAHESKWSERQWDDETQTYLISFFKQISSEPDFQQIYQGLNSEEREKLHRMEKPTIQ